jgi:hypothetical protein
MGITEIDTRQVSLEKKEKREDDMGVLFFLNFLVIVGIRNISTTLNHFLHAFIK